MMKVNELSKTLKDQGIAASSEDASKMAEQMLSKEMPHASEKSDDYDKYEVLLERVQRKVNSEVSTLKETVSALVNEIGFLKEDIKRLKLAKPEPVQQKVEVVTNEVPVQKPVQEPIQEQQQAQEQQVELPKEEVESQKSQAKEGETQATKRTGDIKPGDVNIEDYFYYGNK